MVHKFVKPKVSDYSNKLRVGLRRCHLEQKIYCFKFDGQIQVGTIDNFLILWNASFGKNNCRSSSNNTKEYPTENEFKH